MHMHTCTQTHSGSSFNSFPPVKYNVKAIGPRAKYLEGFTKKGAENSQRPTNPVRLPSSPSWKTMECWSYFWFLADGGCSQRRQVAACFNTGVAVAQTCNYVMVGLLSCVPCVSLSKRWEHHIKGTYGNNSSVLTFSLLPLKDFSFSLKDRTTTVGLGPRTRRLNSFSSRGGKLLLSFRKVKQHGSKKLTQKFIAAQIAWFIVQHQQQVKSDQGSIVGRRES